MADIIDLIKGSHLHVLAWRAWLGELCISLRALPPGPGPAAPWDTITALIDLHMRAADEICAPAVYGTTSEGLAVARQLRDAYEDLAELIAATRLQRPGSPRWWQLARTAMAAGALQCDDEEQRASGRLPPCRRPGFAAPAWLAVAGLRRSAHS